MSDLSINGQTVPSVQIKELKASKIQQAEALLSQKSDGYDTIGFTVGDKAYIAYGRGLAAKPGDSVTLEGKAGKVQFFENEDNTFGEGFRRVASSKLGTDIARSVAGAPFIVSVGATVGLYTLGIGALFADDKIIQQLTQE